MNKLSMFFYAAMAHLSRAAVPQPNPNSNRVKSYRVRGYYVNGLRVYKRPAAKWMPNVKGMRYVRDESKPGIASKLVRR